MSLLPCRGGAPEPCSPRRNHMLGPFGLAGRHAWLEPLTEAHVPALAAAEDRTTYAFTRVPQGRSQAAEYVRAALAEQSEGRTLPWVVRRCGDDAVVGTTPCLDMEVFGRADPVPDADHPPSVLEIGSTWYAASAQRTAVNTEVKLLLLTHAFDVWRVLRVTLKTDARNARSRVAIERLGARFEGIRRAHTLAPDRAGPQRAPSATVPTTRSSGRSGPTSGPDWPGASNRNRDPLRDVFDGQRTRPPRSGPQTPSDFYPAPRCRMLFRANQRLGLCRREGPALWQDPDARPQLGASNARRNSEVVQRREGVRFRDP